MKKAGIFAIAAMLLVAFVSTANAQVTAPISNSNVHAEGFQWGYAGANVGIGMTSAAREADTTSVMDMKAVIGFGSNLDWVGNEVYAEMLTFTDDAGETYTQSVMNIGFNVIIELISNQKLDKLGNINYTGLGISMFAGAYLQMFTSEYSDTMSVDDQAIWGTGGVVVNYPVPIEAVKDWFSVDGFIEVALPMFLMSEDDAVDTMTYENFVGTMNMAFGLMIHFTPNFFDTLPDRRWHFYAGFTMNMISGEDQATEALPTIMMLHFGFQYGW